MLAAFLWLAVFVYTNTLENLQTRGIGSGFGFLNSEAGFKIGEATGIPLPQGGFLWFLISLAVGLAISQFIARRLKPAGLPRGEHWTPLVRSLCIQRQRGNRPLLGFL